MNLSGLPETIREQIEGQVSRLAAKLGRSESKVVSELLSLSTARLSIGLDGNLYHTKAENLKHAFSTAESISELFQELKSEEWILRTSDAVIFGALLEESFARPAKF